MTNRANKSEEYELHEVRKTCGIGVCPSVYEVRRACGIGTCPSVQADKEDIEVYYVIGTSLSEEKIERLGLAGKIGDGEVAMAVPKGLLKGI